MAPWLQACDFTAAQQKHTAQEAAHLLAARNPSAHGDMCNPQVCMACWWLLTALGISYRTVTLTSVSMTMSHTLWDSGGVGLGRRHNSPYRKGALLTFSFIGSPKTPWPASSSFRLCSLLPTQTLYCAGCMLDREAQPLNPAVCSTTPRVAHRLSIGLFFHAGTGWHLPCLP